MDNFITRLREKTGLEITDEEHSWEIRILKEDDLVFEISVPRRVLEWFVTVRRASAEKEAWSDWVDYYETRGETQAELQSAMQLDIECFIERVVASSIRIFESQAFLDHRQSLEWRTAGDWERVTLV